MRHRVRAVGQWMQNHVSLDKVSLVLLGYSTIRTPFKPVQFGKEGAVSCWRDCLLYAVGARFLLATPGGVQYKFGISGFERGEKGRRVTELVVRIVGFRRDMEGVWGRKAMEFL